MLQKQIQADFLAAYKAKDEVTKNALSLLKNQMGLKMKEHGATELNDDAVIKVINAMVKQNLKAAVEYPADCEPVVKLFQENDVISKYLPAAFDDSELLSVLQSIAVNYTEGPLPKRIGQTIGAFNKVHAGKAQGEQIKKMCETFMS
jgi:uncharacterized protein YqeY